ncbi:hypothetical protein AN958_11179 [Leucoagaricus sp. SymC.cos]|nr:hypothetical protein AN958_11179 [Leucoagaricus sp. SymC.cos]
MNAAVLSSQPVPTISELHSLVSLDEQHGATLVFLLTFKSTNAGLSSQLTDSTALYSSFTEGLNANKEGRRTDNVRVRLAKHEVGLFSALVANYQVEELTKDKLEVDKS